MYLESLATQNFKNLASQELEFIARPGLTVFLGNNGQGKTNILEAIRLLALPRPLRTGKYIDLVKFGQTHFQISGTFTPRPEKLQINFSSQLNKKVFRLDGDTVPLARFVGHLSVVLFTPDELTLLSAQPNARRRFLDTILCQLDHDYLRNLTWYNRALKQRNSLLKQLYKNGSNIAQAKQQLRPWTEQLIQPANYLITKRQELLHFLNENLNNIYQTLSEKLTDKLKINATDLENNPLLALSHFEDHIQRELASGHTLIGPHRRDFMITSQDKNWADIASRGEIRTTILALKLLELNYAEQITGRKPILLLDDVFSELDATRRYHLLDLAKNYQTIITAVEMHYFEDLKAEIKIWQVNSGQVSNFVL
jgi:DNA replication and repair protein RecF